MSVDKEARIKNLRELHQAIRARSYPAHMEKDKALALHALEKRIFAINGTKYDFHSKQEI